MAKKTYQELREHMQKVRELMKKRGKKLFLQAARDFFTNHPEVESFGWRQYTPYFNDGDPCEFSVHSEAEDVRIDGQIGYDLQGTIEYSQATRDAYYLERQLLLTKHKEVADIVSILSEDDMQAIFGDHTEVTVKRNGEIETERHDHD